jgi:hypothetical protein
VAGSASLRTSPTADLGQHRLVHRTSASWRGLEFTVTAKRVLATGGFQAS